MVMVVETVDMGIITKRRSKIRDVPAAKESDVVTLSLCQSVLILSLFRSLLKTSLALFYIHYIISTDGSKFIPIIKHYHFIWLQVVEDDDGEDLDLMAYVQGGNTASAFNKTSPVSEGSVSSVSSSSSTSVTSLSTLDSVSSSQPNKFQPVVSRVLPKGEYCTHLTFLNGGHFDMSPALLRLSRLSWQEHYCHFSLTYLCISFQLFYTVHDWLWLLYLIRISWSLSQPPSAGVTCLSLIHHSPLHLI